MYTCIQHECNYTLKDRRNKTVQSPRPNHSYKDHCSIRQPRTECSMPECQETCYQRLRPGSYIRNFGHVIKHTVTASNNMI